MNAHLRVPLTYGCGDRGAAAAIEVPLRRSTHRAAIDKQRVEFAVKDKRLVFRTQIDARLVYRAQTPSAHGPEPVA